MRTLGLIGGMSWESSAQYYRLINEGVRSRLGPLYNAPNVMVTVNFAEIEALQHKGAWDEAGGHMARAAVQLERAGAEAILLCTNTMHKLAGHIEAATNVPFIHIADPTAAAIKAAGLHRVALLGTAFTMEQDFYRGRLTGHHGFDVIVPEAADRLLVHNVIYNELCAGVVKTESRQIYRDVMARLVAAGAQAIILGCTEIMLLVDASDVSIPVFDTTALHAQAGVEFVLGRYNP